MNEPARTSHSVTVIVFVTRAALGLLAAVVFLGAVLVVTGAGSLAALYPEFEYLHLPFVIAAIAFGVCLEIALLLTAVLVGYTRDRRIFEPTALRLVDYLISAIAGATIIIGAVVAMVPGPPALALLLFGGAVAGAACALVLLVLRSLLRGAVFMRVELDEVV